MQDAATSGGVYLCPLDPPPADPKASHPPLLPTRSP
jgi:hypothetical protein